MIYGQWCFEEWYFQRNQNRIGLIYEDFHMPCRCNVFIKTLFSLNSLRPNDAYMHHQPRPSLVQIMACCLFAAKPLSEPMLYYCQQDPLEKNVSQIVFQILTFWIKKMYMKMSGKHQQFCLGFNALNTIYIFDICQCSSNVMVLDKYKGGLKGIAGTKSK